MIHILLKNDDRTFDVVKEGGAINVGDEFQIGYNTQTKQAIMQTITNIIEQRPEKGKWKDESNRRTWGKVA